MNKLEQLFVRACKSKNPETRVGSVLRRFYLLDMGPEYAIPMLADICEKYRLISIPKLIEALSPFNDWKYESRSKGDSRLGVLISVIRLSERVSYDQPDGGLSAPLKIRRLQGELPPKDRKPEVISDIWGDIFNEYFGGGIFKDYVIDDDGLPVQR
jgi:hypothetical protein